MPYTPAARQFHLGLLALAVGLLGGCQKKNTFVQPPPPKVTVAQPIEHQVRRFLRYTGTTKAVDRVEIHARVDGYLDKIWFQDGQKVSKGDPLFTIRQLPFQLRVEAAEADLEKAEADLELARANLARTESVVPQDAVTRQEIDLLRAEVKTAAANVKRAEVALKMANVDLGYTKVLAPISGRIGHHLLDIGNVVKAEETLLATIESYDPIHAYFYLSESDLEQYADAGRSGEILTSEGKGPPLYLGVGSDPDFRFEGYLDYQDLGIDTETGTLLRRGLFPNPDYELMPGQFVHIRTPLGAPVPRLLVEERALGSDLRGEFVLVVNDENVVEQRQVKLGIAIGNFRVIEEGLQSTDWVIINGLQRARTGEKVDPERATMQAPPKHFSLVTPPSAE